jgi:hypothetical protein
MRVRGLVVAVVALVALAAAASIVQAQTDPSVGTWKLNLAKSKYNTGTAPKRASVVIAPSGKGYKLTATVVLADGKTQTIEYTSMYDGTSAAVTGTPDYDSVVIKRIADGTSGDRMKAGKVVQTFMRTISADGKTMTATAKGTNAAGQKVDNTQVFDKQ